MKYDLVIFDLDGTLLDTLSDLKNAVNCALARFDLPPHTREEVRLFVGDGVVKLLTRALPEGSAPETIARAVAAFKDSYDAHMDVETKPYPGITNMLQALNAAGVKVGINSNKYDTAVKSICARHFGDLYFMAVGESPASGKKPDPAGALSILASSGADPARTLYVGDSAVDLETARNAGLDSAWVSWGFRRREEMGDLGCALAFDSAPSLLGHILN